jgi:hypothetical protein
MQQISKHFQDHELVPPAIYGSDEVLSVWYISPFQIRTLEFLRKRYGITYVNTYKMGGDRTEAGTRTPFTSTGADWSFHKLALASDPQFEDVGPDEVREDIIKNPVTFLELGITTLEHGSLAPTWVHYDGRPWKFPGKEPMKEIQIVGG